MLEVFLLCFIPLFVAIDVFGVVPLFMSLTDKMPLPEKNRLVTSSCLTALAISVVFLLAGKALFTFLGITENDFRIGGGIVLLVVAIFDLMSNHEDSGRAPSSDIGVVPIGIPLIMGPAALTTVLISVEAHGPWLTLIALLSNLALVWLVFRQSHWILKIMGRGGAKAVAKVSSLFLAAIAVMMIRVGIMNFLH
jgi:multiple antibiotic resistance protein